MFRAHKLKANVKCERPSRIIFFDVETTGRPLSSGDIAQDFRYGEALYWRRGDASHKPKLERFQIWDVGAFWDWVVSKTVTKKRLVMTSHNLNIDMVALKAFDHLLRRNFTLRSFYVKGMTKIIKFSVVERIPLRKKPTQYSRERGYSERIERTIVFLDNANWWSVPLADLGEMVGLPKGDVDPTRATLEELIPYCQRDVEIMYEVWKRWLAFLDEHNLGNWGITISSQALKSYTHRFMSHAIYCHDTEQVLELERKAYFGGRVEPFWVGQWAGETRYKLDVNSMYPYVMHENPYPTKLLSHWKKIHPIHLEELLDDHLAICRVELETDEPCYPQRGKYGVYYPIGHFTTWLSTPELKYAFQHDHIRETYEAAVYEGRYIFREYVDYLYPLKLHYKQAGNWPYYQAVKLLLNGLYGKFGQKGLHDELRGECDPGLVMIQDTVDWHTGEVGQYIYLGGKVIYRTAQGTSWNTFVAISAHVTAYARMYLWRLIKDAQKDHVYYCDTDSLIVDGLGYQHLAPYVDRAALGALALEDQADSGYILGKKDYCLGKNVRRKGIPKDAELTGEDTWSFNVWPSMRSLLRDGDMSQYYIRPTTRHLHREVTWGKVREDGWIEPFYVRGEQAKTPLDEQLIWRLETELRTIKENRILPHKIVFTMWDYAEGDLRRGADSPLSAPHYRGVAMDTKAQELGYDDFNDFTADVRRQVEQDRRIKEIRKKLRGLGV